MLLSNNGKKKIFSAGSVVKNLPANSGDTSLILGLGRSPGKGNGNPLQYSFLGKPMDRGAWWATVHGVTKELKVTKQLNNNNNSAMQITLEMLKQISNV